MAKYIENEVSKFLATDRLTEANLKKLDTKIGVEADKKDRQSQILDDRRSQRSNSSHVSKRSYRSRGGLSAADLNNLNDKNE